MKIKKLSCINDTIAYWEQLYSCEITQSIRHSQEVTQSQ